MPGYSPIDLVAERLKIPTRKLWEFQDAGWIAIIEKDGEPFIPGDDEYKAKFILHLQQILKLNSQQISRVLLVEEPPYSLHDVDHILAVAQGNRRAEYFHEGAD
jgi:hypothetical protein